MAGEPFVHAAVMPEEVLFWLQPRSGGVYLDGTLGGAGHSRLILQRAPDSRLIGLDRDPAALAAADRILAPFGSRVTLHHTTFDRATDVLKWLGIDSLDGMLLDLGVSSHQLDTADRGFSFRQDAPLDMRMNPDDELTAAEVINQADERELAWIFYNYGEERYSRRIARRIVEQRREHELTRTAQLAQLVCEAVPGGRRPARIHPATRVFQALRIYVNDELGQLERGVEQAIELIRPGGRLVVISFHSLEDRRVKQIFRERSRGCICPPRLPVCQCGHTPDIKRLTGKGVKAGTAEIAVNPRARSAVLRAVERC